MSLQQSGVTSEADWMKTSTESSFTFFCCELQIHNHNAFHDKAYREEWILSFASTIEEANEHEQADIHTSNKSSEAGISSFI